MAKLTKDGTKGGLLYGKTDRDGGVGIPATVVGGGNIIVGGGESIMSEATTKKYCKELSAMNQSTGGRAIDCSLQKEANTGRFDKGGKVGKNEFELTFYRGFGEDESSPDFIDESKAKFWLYGLEQDGGTKYLSKRTAKYKFVGELGEDETIEDYPIEDFYEDESVYKLVEEGEYEEISSETERPSWKIKEEEKRNVAEEIESSIKKYLDSISESSYHAAFLGSTFYCMIPYKDGYIQGRVADHHFKPSYIRLGRNIKVDEYSKEANFYGYLSIHVRKEKTLSRNEKEFKADYEFARESAKFPDLVKKIVINVEDYIDGGREFDISEVKGEIDEALEYIKEEIDKALEAGFYEEGEMGYKDGGRIAKVIRKIGSAPMVEISNYGTTNQIEFADILHKAGKLTLKERNNAHRIAFSDEYATKLLNENLDLFPEQFNKGGMVNEELDKAISDLHKAETLQETMKKANAIIRSNKNVDARLVSEAGLSESSVRKIQQPDFAGRIGFPTYALTNNNASIKRLQERVKMLNKKVEGAEKAKEGQSESYTFENYGGGTIDVNYPEDRVQIYFTVKSKPTPEAYTKLKSNGWHWSPSNSAWQRKITPQAISNAVYIMGAKKDIGETKENELNPLNSFVVSKKPSPYGMDRAVLSLIHNGVDSLDFKKDLAVVRSNPNYTTIEKFERQINNKIYEWNKWIEDEEKDLKEWVKRGGESMKKNPKYKEIKNEIAGRLLLIEKAKELLELEKGIEIEQEHAETFEKLAEGEITPEQAVVETAKEHISENPEYYTKLEEVIEPNNPDEFDEAIMSNIEPHDSWIGNVIKERDVYSQIRKQLQGDSPIEITNEANRIFELYKAKQTPSTPIELFKGIHHEYKNQYELNKAIEALLTEKKDNYSSDEKNFIRKYSGYGGLDKYGKTGKGGLFEYYTPKEVIEKMWALAYKYGYNDGSVLEPSIATGEFLQYAPKDVRAVGYEINEFSAKICKILYPTTEIHVHPFEQTFIKNNWTVKDNTDHLEKFDLVIGNPPYGDFSIVESRYMSGMGEKDHTKARNYVEYFIRRGLDLLKQGGLLIYIVGAQLRNGGNMFLDSGETPVKEYLNNNCTLVDAYRLPDSIFERTSVTADIIVLKKN